MREIIIEESNKYPGGIDAVYIQSEFARRIAEDEIDLRRPPYLRDIIAELEQMKNEGLLERLDDAPGANLSSTRLYAKPGTYPSEQSEGSETK